MRKKSNFVFLDLDFVEKVNKLIPNNKNIHKLTNWPNPFFKYKKLCDFDELETLIKTGNWEEFKLFSPFNYFFENKSKQKLDSLFISKFWILLKDSKYYQEIKDLRLNDIRNNSLQNHNKYNIHDNLDFYLKMEKVFNRASKDEKKKWIKENNEKKLEIFNDIFDNGLYKKCNSDLASLPNESLLSHFIGFGLEEGRQGFNKNIYFDWFLSPVFFQKSWADNAINTEILSSHNIYKMFSKSYQNIEEKINNNNENQIKIFESKELSKNKLNNNKYLFFHIYYEDVAIKQIDYLTKLFSFGFEIIISHSNPISNELFNALEKFTPKYVICLNIGRDILGFQSIFEYVKPNESDIIFLMHTKKSPHLNNHFTDYWSNQMLGKLIFDDRFEYFVDLISNKKFDLIANSTNREIYSGIGECEIEDFKGYKELAGNIFARGTMFLCSAAILKEVFKSFDVVDFLNKPIIHESQHICGGYPHIVERCLSYEALKNNGILWI